MKKLIFILLILVLLIPASTYPQSVSDYLILGNIEAYRITKPEAVFQGRPPIGGPKVTDSAGVVAGADHFPDHLDKTYKVMYVDDSDIKPSSEVEVTQHAGNDSDKWLLHEIDLEFRDYFGVPDLSYTVKNIDGNPLLAFAAGGRDYQWISGNKVIKIEYNDLQMTKPEPLEIVKAYLAKHPSTIEPFTLQQLRSAGNTIKWIKDEMERRLWLCDKWNAQFQAGKVTQADFLRALVKSMTVFINYRQKYYSITATDDINAFSVYLRNSDAAAIQAKLSSYKSWWLANKGRAINL